MKRLLNILLLICLVYSSIAQTETDLKLWYEKPAANWNEALPIGNGRISAMVFGDPAKEQLQLNEGTVWTGGPSRNDNPNALAALPQVRSLIFSGSYDAAQNMVNSNIIAQKYHCAKYQPVGNLNITFAGHATYSDYYRELNIENAITTSTYKVNGVTFKREIFASQPDQVIVVRLTASEPGKQTFMAAMNSPLLKSTVTENGNTIVLSGTSGAYADIPGQVNFNAVVRVANSGGTLTSTASTVRVTNADTATIYVSMATNFVDYKTLTADPLAKAKNYLNAALTKSYQTLLDSHKALFHKYFDRVKIDLGKTEAANHPTDYRIKYFTRQNDPQLVALYYQFGRYLLISASQPGGQPATLQGLWNDQIAPPWGSKYTININTEMNYWPAEVTNLTEMHEPLIQMVKELAEAGKITAQTMYGANGWVTHHNTDIWRTCGPVDGSFWGMYPMGGAWLSQHVWEKYMYSGDANYLATVYPALKGACEFFLSFLVEEPKNKWLVVCPSISPENAPSVHPNSSISAGTTMDNQILFDLFTKTIRATEILNTDVTFRNSLIAALAKMPPMQIGKYSQLQEWMEDWDSPTDTHRHVSHLYGVFPSGQLSPYRTPQLMEAARNSLIYRGDISTGWSMGWKVNWWARFLDGNRAMKLISDQLQLVDEASGHGGTYPNMFDAHPPFQIDGNFGCTSGITEMLMQSYDGNINILPALPDAWKNGSISGLRARGGFEMAIDWENANAKRIVITFTLGGNCRIRVPNTMALLSGGQLVMATGENTNTMFQIPTGKTALISPQANLKGFALKPTYLYDFNTEAGKTYTIVAVEDARFKSATISDFKSNAIVVNFTEPIKKQADYSGLKVKVNTVEQTPDSVRYNAVDASLAIYFKNIFSGNDNVTVSYSAGNIKTQYDYSLTNFADTLVNNLLQGSSPRAISAYTSADGDSVFVRFNKPMAVQTVDFNGFKLIASNNLTAEIQFKASVDFPSNDSLIVLLPASNLVADYSYTLRYAGTAVVAKDNGVLQNFSQLTVSNLSKGLPPQLAFGNVDASGMAIVLEFNKAMAPAFDQMLFFTVLINGKTVPVTDCLNDGKKIKLTFDRLLHSIDLIKVSYSGGKLAAADRGDVAPFFEYSITNSLPEPVYNLIPGIIEAENFTAQKGIQTEKTSDTTGTLNIGWIDAGDWMEYAVDVQQAGYYNIGYRVAVPLVGPQIQLLLNGEVLETVNFTATGAWQIWATISTKVLLPKGKQYIKILVVTSGFNFNFLQFTPFSTALNEVNAKKKVQIYPNLVTDKIEIVSEMNIDKIEIFDCSGKTVLNKELFPFTQKYVLPIKLPNGLYVIKISNKDTNEKARFIVNN